MGDNNTINPAPVISLGILMLIGLFIEASVHMPHLAHEVFEVLWIGTFCVLIVLSIVVSTGQTKTRIRTLKKSIARRAVNGKYLSQPSSTPQDNSPILDVQTMVETFRKYQKMNH